MTLKDPLKSTAPPHTGSAVHGSAAPRSPLRLVPPPATRNAARAGLPAEPAGASYRNELPSTAPRVLLCGPIANPGRSAGGGYEAANRRTSDALRRRGLTVIELPYPKAEDTAPSKWRAYALHFFRCGAYVLRNRHAYDLLHLTPLNMHFAWAEALIVRAARAVGKPVLFDIRAGTFAACYQSGSGFYRWTIDRSLQAVQRIAVEGKAYLPFIYERTGQAAFYFPNYVPALEPPVVEVDRAPRAGRPLRLVYLGRLVAAKGIETLLDAGAILRRRGWQVEIDIIGDGEPHALAAWKQRHDSLHLRWHGSLAFEQIVQIAARGHFFVYPSRHHGEGHSNALNEAMALGLVPVCSDQGFSRLVVSDAGAVLPADSTADRYALAIETVIGCGVWADLSRIAQGRVRKFYSEEVAVPALIKVYRELLVRGSLGSRGPRGR